MADRPGEFETITRLFAPLSDGAPGAFGLTDDAAVLPTPPDTDLVVTSDTLVCGVHFLADDPPETVAAKLLAVNLSDLAAMAAVPAAYTLAAAWPKDTTFAWQQAFADGLGKAQKAAAIHLVGGDTVATPGPMALTLTAMGFVQRGRALRRGGAAPGDSLFVSGTIGDATLGLAALTGNGLSDLAPSDRDALVDRYREPTARTGLGLAIRDIATAAVDISDGLVADVGHMAALSRTRIVIDCNRVPLSAAARRACTTTPERGTAILTGGDDYELAFTVTDAEREALRAATEGLGVEITEIGHVEADPDGVGAVVCRDTDGTLVDVGAGGYRHF